MNPFTRKATLALAVVAAGLATSVPIRAQPATTPEKPAGGGGFIFSLLPKSLQKNPRLDFNIITEMTPEGRRSRRASPEKPIYYVGEAGKPRHLGIGSEEGLKTPTAEQLQRLMGRALAETGFLATDNTPERAPALAIIFQWGSHSFAPPASIEGAAPTVEGAEPTGADASGDIPVPEIVLRRALLDRATLLGGAKFASEVSMAMEQTDQKAAMTRSFAAPEGGDFMGSVGAMMRDPFDELRSRNATMERLVDELFSSSYYVVASAYDYAALAKGQRRLLWRTKMTVNSLGVNMAESIPPLVASAGPYLGRETIDPVVISKRVSREGRVDVGPATVQEYLPATTSEPQKSEPAKK